MNAAKLVLKNYWAVPLMGGVAILALSQFLIPKGGEISEAMRHQAVEPSLPPVPAAAPPKPRPSPPQLETVLRDGDAPDIGQAVDQLGASGIPVTTAQVAHDLDRLGRLPVALAFLDLRTDGQSPELWRLRFELTRKMGRADAARSLLNDAVQGGQGVPSRDMIEAAYALDMPEMLLVAAKNRAIPAPDTTLALDLARRFEAQARLDHITQLDTITRAPWRQADPWLAMRLAQKIGQPDAAKRYAMLLPPKDRDAALEDMVRAQGDKAALRGLLIDRASRKGANLSMIAEQLLAAGFRDDAVALLQRAAATLPPQHLRSQRLLYLMGPRPGPRDLAWLQKRATDGTAASQMEWIAAYAQRDRPENALAFLDRHSLANQPDVQLVRLSLARGSGDDARAAQLLTALLDDPDLTPAQIMMLSANAPRRLPAVLARRLADRRLQTGLVTGQDAMDMAWAAWNRGDAAAAAPLVSLYLRDTPNDPAALRLMADVQRKLKGEAAARGWRERALAHTAPGTREQAEVLESLQRLPEAITIVDKLLEARPRDAALTAYKGRLLLANGQPGRARKLLQP